MAELPDKAQNLCVYWRHVVVACRLGGNLGPPCKRERTADSFDVVKDNLPTRLPIQLRSVTNSTYPLRVTGS